MYLKLDIVGTSHECDVGCVYFDFIIISQSRVKYLCGGCGLLCMKLKYEIANILQNKVKLETKLLQYSTHITM